MVSSPGLAERWTVDPSRKKIVRADAQTGRRIFIFDILRRVANDAVGMEAIVRPDGCAARQINMRPDAATRPEPHLAVNDRVRPDFDRGIQLGARADDGRGMDHVRPMRRRDSTGRVAAGLTAFKRRA